MVRHRNMRIPATVVALIAGASAPRAAWIRPHLLANALVGLLYCARENEAILRVGGALPLGMHYRPRSTLENQSVNVLTHVVLTALVLRRMSPAPPAPPAVLAWEALWLSAIDLDAVYPSRAGLAPYVATHVVVLLMLLIHLRR